MSINVASTQKSFTRRLGCCQAVDGDSLDCIADFLHLIEDLVAVMADVSQGKAVWMAARLAPPTKLR